jgi:hypothetical protein
MTRMTVGEMVIETTGRAGTGVAGGGLVSGMVGETDNAEVGVAVGEIASEAVNGAVAETATVLVNEAVDAIVGNMAGGAKEIVREMAAKLAQSS